MSISALAYTHNYIASTQQTKPNGTPIILFGDGLVSDVELKLDVLGIRGPTVLECLELVAAVGDVIGVPIIEG
jgi:hypothetical protein